MAAHLRNRARPESLHHAHFSRVTCSVDVEASRKFWIAAASTVGIVPYTIVVMTGKLDRLVELARRAEKGGGGELSASGCAEAESLLERWVVLKGVRSLFPLVGAVVAAVVLLA
ncbi:hypothetical protein BU25DRAFT_45343 [Macroventuria anomochaeta]|uniref:Uncharacterized protein n=1 Tax=Macroventuria anomochaeta TaxID=301207 RepID=A0ACB6S138_9PLEO|nr:uncharacterized protein BU25DRAFT_45343 [Macroventuria anomochaeta]KAF2627856.1 hypothetical protein BU25DRAFT_45343 [Macroventuria anomochaeta]